MMEFSWMLLKLKGKGNFTQEAELMRNDYESVLRKLYASCELCNVPIALFGVVTLRNMCWARNSVRRYEFIEYENGVTLGKATECPRIHNNRDYYTLTYGARSIDLDDVHTDDNAFVVTGVRFRVVGAHLNLEARLSEFSFETGQLVDPKENSYWKSNDNTDVSGDKRAKIELKDPDLPTRTIAKSVPDSRHNQYLEFSASSFSKDASQSTVPFIDIQDVVSKPSVAIGWSWYLSQRQTWLWWFYSAQINDL
ncbi:hypothetical protein EVAR_69759_1 [Eumeta japonica]|uniref:Uncharacterized protein n=1 Tax=Eumeta variegata TaxID=151549 RepID=A0A4C1TDY9_EUMVA|nr:hypothetical protein EVAR_69759_1 [Eumeta japonica]